MGCEKRSIDREKRRAQSMTTIELDGVSKRYGETTAIADATLSIADGEFFTLVGPSGCGKTTTLRLIAGFEAPTSGAIRFDGEDVAAVPPENRGVGVVFQNYALFPHMTVAENVGYGLQFSDPPGDLSPDERVQELLALVDLAGMGDRDPDSLSGGQQQRVALARALAPGPRVLLLDEPMSALDAQLRESLRLQLKRIQSELGITTVYVTHDQEEALSISDRVAVLSAGAIEQIGTPQAIYRRPDTPFVARFVGDNNVFSGRVMAIDQDSETATIAIDGASIRATILADRSIDIGDTVTICVRPEYVSVMAGVDPTAGDGPSADQASEGVNQLTGSVVSSEFLGETTRVHVSWGDTELLVRTTDPIDGQVTLAFDPDAVRIVSIDS